MNWSCVIILLQLIVFITHPNILVSFIEHQASANVVADSNSGFSRGFGFVEISSNEKGYSVITMFNGKDIDGRSLKVNEARLRDERSSLLAVTETAVAAMLAVACGTKCSLVYSSKSII